VCIFSLLLFIYYYFISSLLLQVTLHTSHILLYHLGSGLHAEASGIETDVIIVGIAPGEPCVILVVSDAAILGMLHEFLGLLPRELLLLLDVEHTVVMVATEEDRHEVFALTEDVIATSTDDDAVFVAYHVCEGAKRVLRKFTLALAKGSHGEEEFVYRTFVEESLHLVEHATLAGHLQQVLASIERYPIMLGKQLAYPDSATSTLARNRNNHDFI